MHLHLKRRYLAQKPKLFRFQDLLRVRLDRDTLQDEARTNDIESLAGSSFNPFAIDQALVLKDRGVVELVELVLMSHSFWSLLTLNGS